MAVRVIWVRVRIMMRIMVRIVMRIVMMRVIRVWRMIAVRVRWIRVIRLGLIRANVRHAVAPFQAGVALARPLIVIR